MTRRSNCKTQITIARRADVASRQVKPKHASQRRTSSSKSGDHISVKTQKLCVTTPAAVDGFMKPNTVSRRQTLQTSNGQKATKTQRSAAVAPAAAIVSVKPVANVQRQISSKTSNGQVSDEIHCFVAVAGGRVSANADTIATLRELYRRRRVWHVAEKGMTLRATAMCRRWFDGDKKLARAMLARIEEGTETNISAIAITAPLLAARAPLEKSRLEVEKQLIKLAKTLPIFSWCEAINGFGPLSLAVIVGEAGDVGNYKSISALWKRMGLAVIKGERQRRVPGVEALEHGYSPSRRSAMWNIGNGLIGMMGHGPRPAVGENIEARKDLSEWQKLFVRIMREEVKKVTPTWNGPEHVREAVENKKGVMCESFSAHVSNRAKRRVEKKFLAKFYVAWRGLKFDESKYGSQLASETRMSNAAAPHAASPGMKPTSCLQRGASSSKKNGGQSRSENQYASVAIPAAANLEMKPTSELRRRKSNGKTAHA